MIGAVSVIEYPNPDINRDWEVDLYDFVLIGTNYGKHYGTARGAGSATSENLSKLRSLVQDSKITNIMLKKLSAKRNAIRKINYTSDTSNKANIWLQFTEISSDNYTVEVMVNGVTDLSGYQFDVSYNAAKFRYLSCSNGYLLN